ncbi:MAG: hypothetical protein OEM96_02870 [Gemmatimonadota bacterium]|nr:hypothetical protein [Gemmatimonadota bacterium]
MTETELRPATVQERRRYYGRALRVGLVVSLVIHLFLIFVVARALSLNPASYRSPSPRRLIEIQGLPVVQVGEVLPLDAADPEAVRLPPEERQLEPERETDPAADAADGAAVVPVPARARVGVPRLTNAEKLQPREGDERLWDDFGDQPIPEYLAANPYADYEGEIRARLGVILDSLALSEEQRSRAMEWLSGEEGHEWGVSPDGIHINGLVIPVNLQQLLQEEGPAGRESRQELRDLRDIQLQDLLDDVEAIQRERAREMRERTKQELERRARDSLEAVPDST